MPQIYQISGAISSGDYQTSINIATKSLSNKKVNEKAKCYYLSVLARAYFELRDFEKLKLLVAKFDEYQAKISLRKRKNDNSIWEYYRCFLKSDYEACKLLCSQWGRQLKNNTWGTDLKKIQYDFLYAIAYYENNEIDKAKQVFLNIMQKAPDLYLSVLSEKYIGATQGDKLYFEEILPDGNYQVLANKKLKAMRLIKTVCLILVIVALVAIDHIPGTKDLSKYDSKLQIALSQQYTDFEVLDHINVEANGVVKDALVFIENETAGIDVGFIITYDNGNSYDVKIMESNITYGSYSLESFTGNHSIELLISNQSYTDENNSFSTSVIQSSDNQYFIYAKCVE